MVTILSKNILKAGNTKLGADNMPKLKKKSFLFYLLHPRTLKPALCPSLCPSSPFLSSSSSSILPEGPVVKAGLKLSMVKLWIYNPPTSTSCVLQLQDAPPRQIYENPGLCAWQSSILPSELYP